MSIGNVFLGTWLLLTSVIMLACGDADAQDSLPGDMDAGGDGDSDSDGDGDSDGDSDSDADGDSDSDGDGDTGGGTDSETGQETESETAALGSLPWLHVEGNRIMNPNGDDVVLRGVSTIDIGSVEEYDGGFRPMIDRLTDKNDTAGGSPGWYPTVIRIPVYPTDSDVESPIAYTPGDEGFYNHLLRPVVDYCREKKLYVIIDWHYIASTTEHQQTTSGFWADMAPRFSEDSHVLFELYNEPINSGSWETVRSDMQSWYDVVREGAPENLVLVGTPNWSQYVGQAAANPIEGANVVYVAHMYPMHWDMPDLRDEITDAAALAPVFITEWGFEQGSDAVVDGTVTSYGDPFKAFINDLNLSTTSWVAHYSWFPAMYQDQNWTLATGDGRMGGFAKQWLYEKREDNLPGMRPGEDFRVNR